MRIKLGKGSTHKHSNHGLLLDLRITRVNGLRIAHNNFDVTNSLTTSLEVSIASLVAKIKDHNIMLRLTRRAGILIVRKLREVNLAKSRLKLRTNALGGRPNRLSHLRGRSSCLRGEEEVEEEETNSKTTQGRMPRHRRHQ